MSPLAAVPRAAGGGGGGGALANRAQNDSTCPDGVKVNIDSDQLTYCAAYVTCLLWGVRWWSGSEIYEFHEAGSFSCNALNLISWGSRFKSRSRHLCCPDSVCWWFSWGQSDTLWDSISRNDRFFTISSLYISVHQSWHHSTLHSLAVDNGGKINSGTVRSIISLHFV
jgi:hypothetical protein